MRRRPVVTMLLMVCAVAAWSASACAGGLFERRDAGGVKQDSQQYQEDINARRLLKKAELHIEMGQNKEAESVLISIGDRYPESKVRFEAWLMLGDYYHRMRQFEKAVNQFERVSRAMMDGEETVDEKLVVQSLLKAGMAFYESNKFNQCIAKMRTITNEYGDREEANDAYFYIGLCHFKRKNWINAIRSLRLVGTNIPADEANEQERLEARKRLFVKVEDADLSVLKEKGENLEVLISTPPRPGGGAGDTEKVELKPLTMKGDMYIGDIGTGLGEPNPGDGTVQVYGVDKMLIEYVDANTADHKRNIKRPREVVVLGNGVCHFSDGAYKEMVSKVVLGESAFLQVIDYDADLSAQRDGVEVRVRTRRPLPREENPEDEDGYGGAGEGGGGEEKVRYEDRDEVVLRLLEMPVPKPEFSESARKALAREHLKKEKDWEDEAKRNEALAKADKFIAEQIEQHKRNIYHSGVFVGECAVVELPEGVEANRTNDQLEARAGDILELEYIDRHHTDGDVERVVIAQAGTLRPKEAPLEVIDKVVKEQSLKVEKLLQQAKALLDLGKIFQELGLNDRAKERFAEGIDALDDIAAMRTYPVHLKEEMYYVRSQLLLAMGDLNNASRILTQLLREFPETEFGEGALMQLAELAIQEHRYSDAVRFFSTVLQIPTGLRKPEAQFRIGETYEEWGLYEAKERGNPGQISPTQGANALKAYDACASTFPESPWAGKAVVKVANYYLGREMFAQAIEKFEKILADYEDTTDVVPYVLLHYGRCLYKMKNYQGAVDKWQQIIVNYPTADEAGKAKRYIQAVQSKL